MLQNRVFNNTKWIIACKVIQSLIQLVVGMITARYLGPSNYGLISYAASVVSFAAPVMQLGLNSTVVQEYVNRSDEEGTVAGTAMIMNMISGVACMIGVASFVCIANRGEKDTIIVCVLYSLGIFFRAAEMLQYWFQSKLMSRYASLAVLCAYVAVSVYKIYLLITGKSVYWFALSHAVEYGVTGILIWIVYRKVSDKKLRFSWKLAREMFQKSKYYILASLMVSVFQNTDHIMLKMMTDNAENGYYTTAITCATVTQFVFLALIDSARPVILEKYQQSREAFERNVSGLYTIVIYATALQSVCFTIFAKLMVYVLYGKSYFPAIPVLQILAWQVPFAFMGSIRNVWILAENKHDILWVINLCGVLANILLNALMIPMWGACGAACASMLTQAVTNFVVGFFMKPIRPNNRLLIRGLHPRTLLEVCRYCAKELSGGMRSRKKEN